MKRALCQLSYPGMSRDAYPISVRLLSVHLEGDGAQGGSRTLKTLILSQVPMPVRLLGQKARLIVNCNDLRPIAGRRRLVYQTISMAAHVYSFKLL